MLLCILYYVCILIVDVFVLFQAKIQKHQAFEAEVAAHSNAIVQLDKIGQEMIDADHYAQETIRVSHTLHCRANTQVYVI